MSMEAVIDKMAESISATVPTPENEYIGEDGLLHCSVCHERVERIVCLPELGINRKVRCICDCVKKEQQAFEDKMKREKFERKRSVCFADSNMWKWTFEHDDRKNPKISDAMQNYVKNFTEFKKDGKGLLLHGTVGTGKTYLAACVANSLIDEDMDVFFRTFKQIERELWNADNKSEYMKSLTRYQFVVFDDLGSERESKYMLDVVFDIIDTRYKSGLPFIITTNLTTEVLKKPQDIGYSRIYDRILERCFPVEVAGASRRRQNTADTFFDVKNKLGL